jgi:hypothetical protein
MTNFNGRVHPVADLFPMLDTDEMAELVADITANGLNEPGWLTPDGTLLDGRNRNAACITAGVAMQWRTYTGDDPIGFVVSANIRRRHLTDGQKGFIALELVPLYEAEARQRQADAAAQTNQRRSGTLGADLHQAQERAPRTTDHAAKSIGTSGRVVAQAKRIAQHAPDLAEKVKAGELAIDAAEKQTKRRIAEREEQAARETTLTAVTVDAHGDRWRLLAGDFRERLAELPAGCVDLIVTDPPYPTESLHLYSALSKIAAHVLADDGICVVLTGVMSLDVVMVRLGEHLNYGWIYCQPLPGANSRIMGRHIMQSFKPWLAFTRNQWPSGRIDWHPDMLDPSYRAKDQYRWQQDGNPVKLLIDALCPKGGTVCDPFTGTGAYGVATLEMGRRFIGAELDSDRLNMARTALDGTVGS